MTAKEAYGKICEYFNDKPRAVGLREYDNMFGFFLAPKGSKNEQGMMVGSMVCVMKKTGEVELASDMEDQSFYRKPWTEVEIDG